jgi:hypothetical protein
MFSFLLLSLSFFVSLVLFNDIRAHGLPRGDNAPLAMTTLPRQNGKRQMAFQKRRPLTVFALQTILSRKGGGNDTATTKWKTALRDSALALRSTQNDRGCDISLLCFLNARNPLLVILRERAESLNAVYLFAVVVVCCSNDISVPGLPRGDKTSTRNDDHCHGYDHDK